MKRKVVWLVVTGWMIATLLLASCAPAIVKEEAEKVAPPKEKEEVVVPKEVVAPKEEANLVKWTGKKLDGTVVEKMIEKPKYGGVHIHGRETQPTEWDDVGAPGASTGNWANTPMTETLLTRDWTKGPGGTGEWVSLYYDYPPIGLEAGLLAESWELLDPGTLAFHIRQGVRYALDPTSEASRLVGGREFTADDVVFNLRRNFSIGYQSVAFPYLIDMKNVANSIYVSPTDKWTVVMKSKPEGGGSGSVIEMSSGGFNTNIAPEVVERYGKITDWKKVVGTGPFLLKDYVGASSLTYVRNSNYWMKDPFFPENQLPYLDGFRVLIIPDLSTRLAALRTGQIDNLFSIETEDAESLMKTNPELEWGTFLARTPGINPRNDTKPFDDVRVRRALNMAVNKPALVDLYYGGKAELFAYPVSPSVEYMDVYTPLEEMPESVRELYEYHPDKARQLLAEAGYPDGFKTEVLVWKPADVDLLSIIKEDWAKIGVDLKIDVKEFTVYTAMRSRFTYKQMIFNESISKVTVSGMFKLAWAYPGNYFNLTLANDPLVPKLFETIHANYFDRAKKAATLTNPLSEVLPGIPEAKGLPNWKIYANEQAWMIPLPSPYIYNIWQPWLKGYYGTEYVMAWSFLDYPGYIWLDQGLKKAMGR